MTGWLVNDRLTAIPGTRTLWHHLVDGLPGLVDRTTGTYAGLPDYVERLATVERPDYVIRNAAYFRRLNLDAPVISFVQDILQGIMREQLVDACSASRLLVFNSEYTRSEYPELIEMPYRVIPVGTDAGIFHYRHRQIPSDHMVMWVGSRHPVKGYMTMRDIADTARWKVRSVLKDMRPISQEELAEAAHMSDVGICTSTQETQHLAGIEMGLCGVPLVTTNVGAYWNRPDGPWGMVHKGDWHEEIEYVSKLDRRACANYWVAEGFTLPRCLMAWRSAAYSVGVEADVVR